MSFGSIKLEIWILQNQHRICKTVNQGCERERLTPGTHATERQRQGRRSSPAKLDDGEVSVRSKGIYVFLSSRRTRWPNLLALYWTLGCSPSGMAARRRCGRYAGEPRHRRRGRGCGQARATQGESIGRRITARGEPERSGHVAGDLCEFRRGGARGGVGNAASPVLG